MRGSAELGRADCSSKALVSYGLDVREVLERTNMLSNAWSPCKSLPFDHRKRESAPVNHWQRLELHRRRCFGLIVFVVGSWSGHELAVVCLARGRGEGRSGGREGGGAVGEGGEGIKGEEDGTKRRKVSIGKQGVS